jgi:hypothetical protein
MLISLVPLLVMLLGLVLVYRKSPPQHPQTSAVGMNMFWVGLLVFLIQLPAFMVELGRLSYHR